MTYNEVYDYLKSSEDFQIEHLHGDFMKKLKNEAEMETARKFRKGSVLSEVKKVLKRAKSRPILTKSVIIDGKQIFTDSWVMFRMTEHVPGLEVHDKKTAEKYPDVKRFFKKWDQSFITTEDEITRLTAESEDGIIKFDIDEKRCLLLNSGYLKSLLKILQYKKNDPIELFYCPDERNGYLIRPVYTEKDNNEAIIIPYIRP